MKQISSLLLVVTILLSACSPSKEELPRLIKALSSSDTSTRSHAALELARYGSDASKAIPALSQLLRDPNGGVKSSAAYALDSIGTPEAKKALEDYKRVSEKY